MYNWCNILQTKSVCYRIPIFWTFKMMTVDHKVSFDVLNSSLILNVQILARWNVCASLSGIQLGVHLGRNGIQFSAFLPEKLISTCFPHCFMGRKRMTDLILFFLWPLKPTMEQKLLHLAEVIKSPNSNHYGDQGHKHSVELIKFTSLFVFIRMHHMIWLKILFNQ